VIGLAPKDTLYQVSYTFTLCYKSVGFYILISAGLFYFVFKGYVA